MKMNVLIANKFYYDRGGSDIYSMRLEKSLLNAGHKVAFFAMKHPKNNQSVWEKYWVNPFSWKTPLRPFGDNETKTKFNELIDYFKPDIVHLNIIHTHISPIIAEIAHNKGIKVIWTMHEYKLLCPVYICLNSKGKICEKCFGGFKKFCFKYNCKSNFIASYILQKEAEKWNRERLEKYTDAFICPSNFMKQKMIQGGFSENKLYVLHNFVEIPKPFDRVDQNSTYYLYAGRLSKEKGISTLCSIASELPYKLKIVGSGPLEKELRKKYKNCEQIEFLGGKNHKDVLEIMANAKFTVCPSEWHEVCGLVIIESLIVGTPVLCTNIGGMPELIEQGVDGELFESKSDLRDKIKDMWEHAASLHVSQNSKKIQNFSLKDYLEKLTKIYYEQTAVAKPQKYGKK
jgi:glycosyltransferase involved in cell wall biosynthesis